MMKKIHETVRMDKTAIVSENVFIEENALIAKNVTIQDDVKIGSNVRIWDNSYIRPNVKIGNNCIIARGTYIDTNVAIGNNVKIQNRNNISMGVTLEDGVFVGPNVTFSNDKYPRAINSNETLKSAHDWVCSETLVKKGASLGAGCVIVCGVKIGEWATIGAGAVVTKNIPNHALVIGNPAKIVKWVSKSGFPLVLKEVNKEYAVFHSKEENLDYEIPINDYKLSTKE